MVRSLEIGELDVLPLALPYQADTVETCHLFFDEFLLAYDSRHLFAKKKHLLTEDLNDQDLSLLEEGHYPGDHAFVHASYPPLILRYLFRQPVSIPPFKWWP